MELNGAAIAAIVVLGIVEFGLLIAAWIVLFRTPKERLTLPKWAWALLCLIQFVGPIVFFVAGRKPAQVTDVQTAAPGATADRVIDSLYGQGR